MSANDSLDSEESFNRPPPGGDSEVSSHGPPPRAASEESFHGSPPAGEPVEDSFRRPSNGDPVEDSFNRQPEATPTLSRTLQVSLTDEALRSAAQDNRQTMMDFMRESQRQNAELLDGVMDRFLWQNRQQMREHAEELRQSQQQMRDHAEDLRLVLPAYLAHLQSQANSTPTPPTPAQPPAPVPSQPSAQAQTPIPSAPPLDRLVFTFQELGVLGTSAPRQVRLDRRLSSLVEREDFLDDSSSLSDPTSDHAINARLPIPPTPDESFARPTPNAPTPPTPNLPHPSLNPPHTAHVPPNRRLSVTDRAILGSSALASTTQTQVVLKPPEHSIRLKRLTVREILGFLMHITDYQYAHRVPLHAASLIDPPLVRQLLARHPQLNYASFQAFNNLQVFQLLQFDAMPQTLFDAYHRLDSAVRFFMPNDRYRPSAVDFYPFYTALLAYRREFTAAYDLITGMLQASLIPLFSTKEYGLLRIFLNKIPFMYGQRLHAAHLSHRISSPPKDGVAADPSRVTNIHQYITVFFKYVDVHYRLYCDARSFGQLFGGTEFHAGSNRDRQRRDPPKQQRLNAMNAMFAPTPDDHDNEDFREFDSAPPLNDDDDPDDPDTHPFLAHSDMAYPDMDDSNTDDANRYSYYDHPSALSDPAVSMEDIAADPSVSAISPAPPRKFSPSDRNFKVHVDKDRQSNGFRHRSPPHPVQKPREFPRPLNRNPPPRRYPTPHSDQRDRSVSPSTGDTSRPRS